jgi:hypothetical protein
MKRRKRRKTGSGGGRKKIKKGGAQKKTRRKKKDGADVKRRRRKKKHGAHTRGRGRGSTETNGKNGNKRTKKNGAGRKRTMLGMKTRNGSDRLTPLILGKSDNTAPMSARRKPSEPATVPPEMVSNVPHRSNAGSVGLNGTQGLSPGCK